MEYDREGLLKYIKQNFKLPELSYHGPAHWARVKNIGMKLCDCNPDADRFVVELFAWCHDMDRISDFEDTEHGGYAVTTIVNELQGRFFLLNDRQLEDLTYAVQWHSHGHTLANKTIQVCWDSDRLDLGRVGIIPDPNNYAPKLQKIPNLSIGHTIGVYYNVIEIYMRILIYINR